MTDSDREMWKKQIDQMSQIEMAELRRFAPSGHPVFDRNNGLSSYFNDRFQSLGGFTPTISKYIGWGES